VYDEPFADSSQLPTLLVSELARASVTVTLSGDGGDELFGGYDRYRWVPRVADGLGRVPAPVRSGAARALRAVPPRAWERGAALLPRRYRPRIPASKASKLAAILVLDDAPSMYTELRTHWDSADDVLLGANGTGDGPAPSRAVGAPGPSTRDAARWMMHMDAATYLPDDILVKLDRASMSVGLEARVPLLDHRVVELAARLPVDLRLGAGAKPLLRRLLYERVPRELVERPKSGFGVPLGEWLRGPLRPWAEELLAPARLDADGFLRTSTVRAIWGEHVTSRRDWEYHLWDVLMFQAWLDATTANTRSGGSSAS
jgi:asparagine synthase (glutamine-hydrolysing)